MATVQLTILDFMPSEEKCLEDLRATRWSDGIICPICGSTEVKKNGTENGKQRYYCHGHGGTFRDTTGTIFHYSKLPLPYWYYFIFHYSQNDSANHLKEVLGISYNTALRMVRKIQSMLNGKSNEIKLHGDVEFDELYLPKFSLFFLTTFENQCESLGPHVPRRVGRRLRTWSAHGHLCRGDRPALSVHPRIPGRVRDHLAQARQDGE